MTLDCLYRMVFQNQIAGKSVSRPTVKKLVFLTFAHFGCHLHFGAVQSQEAVSAYL